MSTLSQRLAKLDAVTRRRIMDERNAKRRAEYAVRPKVLLWDDPARELPKRRWDDQTVEPDFDDLCNWYSDDTLPAAGRLVDE